MLKNKLKIISVLMILILFFTLPIVRAENENNDINLINETYDDSEHQQEETTTSIENNLKQSDVYLSGTDITIDYIVDGNLFVFADNVTIDSQIGGDAFIFAQTVTITEKGYIYSNLFTIAQNINISGVAYDVYSISNNTTINGYIYRDLKNISTSLNINGIVGRNAYVTASNIHFAENNSENEKTDINSKGMISGDFNYSSSTKITIPDGAVGGTANFTKIKENNSNFDLQNYLLSLGIFITTVAIIWLICLWLAPKFLEKVQTALQKNKLSVILYGLLTPIASILAIAILLILGLTSYIAILYTLTLGLLLSISAAIFTITINNLVCNKLKIEKTTIKFGFLLMTACIIWLISLIPYIGIILSCATYVIGLGIIMRSIIPAKKKVIKENIEK